MVVHLGRADLWSVHLVIILDPGTASSVWVSDVTNLTHINKLMSSAGMGLIGRIAA
jgi:hypothetical protein